MNRAGRYSTNTPVGIVIIELSLGSFRQNARLGSFRQNSYWVRSAKTPLGLFRQNARWVRLAKTRPAHRWTVNATCRKCRKCRKTHGRRGVGRRGGAFCSSCTFCSIKAAHCSHGSNRMHCGRVMLGASASAHDQSGSPWRGRLFSLCGGTSRSAATGLEGSPFEACRFAD